MNDFVNIHYNNKEYNIYKKDSLLTLLNWEELVMIPLSLWKELLEKKDYTVDASQLYTVLVKKILLYDKSVEVNSFIYKNKKYWLNKDTRVDLVNLLNSGLDSLDLVLSDCIVSLDPETAKHFLAELEIYAYKCYINTQKHLLAIKELKSMEDLIKYDYTIGYPEKLVLNESKLKHN